MSDLKSTFNKGYFYQSFKKYHGIKVKHSDFSNLKHQCVLDIFEQVVNK